MTNHLSAINDPFADHANIGCQTLKCQDLIATEITTPGLLTDNTGIATPAVSVFQFALPIGIIGSYYGMTTVSNNLAFSTNGTVPPFGFDFYSQGPALIHRIGADGTVNFYKSSNQLVVGNTTTSTI